MVLTGLLIYAWAGAVGLTRPITDFYVAGAKVPAVYNGMAIAAGLVAVPAYPALAGALAPGWRGALLILGGGAGGLVLSALLLVPYLRKFGGYTVPDFLGERFGSATLRPLAVGAVFLCSFPALAAVLVGLAVILTRIFAIDLATGIGVAAGMLLLCTFLGGMRSSSLGGIAQYAVLIAGSFAALGVLLWQHGAASSGLEATALFDAVAGLRLDTFAAPDRVNRIALAFCLVTGTAALPHLLMRGFTARSVEEARNSFLLAVPLAGVVFIAAPAYSTLLGGGSAMTGNALSAGLTGLTGTAAIAACVALGSGLLLALANSLSYDLYFKSWDVTAPTERRLFIARACLFLVAALAAGAALAWPVSVIVLAGTTFSLAASGLLPALLLGVWWKRANGQGALAGMVAGLVVCIYYIVAPRYFPYAFYETSSVLSNATELQAAAYRSLRQTYYMADPETRGAVLTLWEMKVREIANWWGVSGMFAGVFGVPVGLVMMTAVSLFTTAPSKDVQSFVEDLRKAQLA